VDTVRR